MFIRLPSFRNRQRLRDRTFIIRPREISVRPGSGWSAGSSWEEDPGALQRIAKVFQEQGRLCEFDIVSGDSELQTYRLTCYDPGRDNWADLVYQELLKAGFEKGQIRVIRNFGKARLAEDSDFEAVSASERGWE